MGERCGPARSAFAAAGDICDALCELRDGRDELPRSWGCTAETEATPDLFVNLTDKTKHSSPKLLPGSSPHLVSGDEARDDILYSCQDTASNNLMAVSLEDLEMNV